MTREIHTRVDPFLPPAYRTESLSRKALAVLTNTQGVTCVLNGMRHPNYVDDSLGALRSPPFDVDVHLYEAIQLTCNQTAPMVTQGNIASDFTPETDRSEKVMLSKLRGRQVVLFLPEVRHSRMQDRLQGQMMKAAAAWDREGSWC